MGRVVSALAMHTVPLLPCRSRQQTSSKLASEQRHGERKGAHGIAQLAVDEAVVGHRGDVALAPPQGRHALLAKGLHLEKHGDIVPRTSARPVQSLEKLAQSAVTKKEAGQRGAPLPPL